MMFYLATVGIQVDDSFDKNGNPKLTKSKIPVEAESIEEATLVLHNYLAEDVRTTEIIDIKKFPVDACITTETHEKYYKRIKTETNAVN